MNLLEKALIIQDIKHNIQIIESTSLPLFERAKATHRLKEIFQFCEQPIFKKTYPGLTRFYTPEQMSTDLVAKSNFQKSYRGMFQEEGLLFAALNQNPVLGWAILYDAPTKKWQIWLIPQANKGVIHSSWKDQLNEAYLWLSQQQHLLQCLIEDNEIEQICDQARLEQYTAPQAAPMLVQIPTQDNIAFKVGQFVAQPSLVRIPTFDHANYVLHFEQLKDLDALFVYLSTSKQPQHFSNSPVIVAERLNSQQQFMGYLIVFSCKDTQIGMQLATEYCNQFEQQLGMVKQFSWQTWQDNAENLENFYDAFINATPLLEAQTAFVFIPKALILTQRLITFDEAPSTHAMPLLLMRERLKYRIIHGETWIGNHPDVLAYASLVFSRQDGLSLQRMDALIDTLPSPISAETLYAKIQTVLAEK
ncbi:hypothetical protein [Acinetobacter sp. MD2(2019)]|uniref:hypothetical protein n=1 Tax=Acinetobacter sp. MD2(2019) TaxID=2605273 RepID=UPI002D1F7197|nr:hypothetical protein [Acinetobacter sp. MD2(2019)]MEB3753195.1 hypothetical protein [Acinetobacter sp. MD2(2019)]